MYDTDCNAQDTFFYFHQIYLFGYVWMVGDDSVKIYVYCVDILLCIDT